ncbi:MAG: hypothetical protein U0X93_16060 [Anaerolineales bacterium]
MTTLPMVPSPPIANAASFLDGSLPRQLDGVFAAFSFYRVCLPPGGLERFHNRFDEGSNGESSRRWVVDDDRASHGQDYTQPPPPLKRHLPKIRKRM